jgi:pyrophosphatase PpaX
MRFPVVLFDLDGTVIDSGAIILASMRHATLTVLAREIEDETLMASVGGQGLAEQMRVIDELRADELVRVYREHNEPLHSTLEPCSGMLDVLRELAKDRRLGIVTAKRRATVDLAFEVLPELEPLFELVVGSEHTARHKPDPEPLLYALDRLGVDAAEAAYVGDSPFDIRAAKAAGVYAVGVTWGGIHPVARLEAEEPDVLVDSAQELLDVL